MGDSGVHWEITRVMTPLRLTAANTHTRTHTSCHTLSSVKPAAVITIVSQSGWACVTVWWKSRAVASSEGWVGLCWGGSGLGARVGVGRWGSAVSVSERALGRLELQEGDIQLYNCIKNTLHSTQTSNRTNRAARKRLVFPRFLL